MKKLFLAVAIICSVMAIATTPGQKERGQQTTLSFSNPISQDTLPGDTTKYPRDTSKLPRPDTTRKPTPPGN